MIRVADEEDIEARGLKPRVIRGAQLNVDIGERSGPSPRLDVLHKSRGNIDRDDLPLRSDPLRKIADEEPRACPDISDRIAWP